MGYITPPFVPYEPTSKIYYKSHRRQNLNTAKQENIRENILTTLAKSKQMTSENLACILQEGESTQGDNSLRVVRNYRLDATAIWPCKY